jgi:hypothetical protein
VAGTFDTIHEKLEDLPLERPLEKLKDVKRERSGNGGAWLGSRLTRFRHRHAQGQRRAASCHRVPPKVQRVPRRAQPRQLEVRL